MPRCRSQHMHMLPFCSSVQQDAHRLGGSGVQRGGADHHWNAQRPKHLLPVSGSACGFHSMLPAITCMFGAQIVLSAGGMGAGCCMQRCIAGVSAWHTIVCLASNVGRCCPRWVLTQHPAAQARCIATALSAPHLAASTNEHVLAAGPECCCVTQLASTTAAFHGSVLAAGPRRSRHRQTRRRPSSTSQR